MHACLLVCLNAHIHTCIHVNVPVFMSTYVDTPHIYPETPLVTRGVYESYRRSALLLAGLRSGALFQKAEASNAEGGSRWN